MIIKIVFICIKKNKLVLKWHSLKDELGPVLRLGLNWVSRTAWISNTSISQKDLQNDNRVNSIGFGPVWNNPGTFLEGISHFVA